MGVLDNLTEEYFGDKVREEDMVLKYSIDEENPPKHKLTLDEKSFLNALASYTLLLDKSLFFQIESLQRHTKLVLSGECRERAVFPRPAMIEKEIAELDKMIQELRDKLERKDSPENDFNLLRQWERQRRELENARGKSVHNVATTTMLGRYFHNDGKNSQITLYIDTIESEAGDPHYTMLLMGQVLIHEYFHSFYFHAGTATGHSTHFAEEPMAEYGSLVVLDSVASSRLSIATVAADALRVTLRFVKSKQACIGLIAAYGFGAYLFEKHKDVSSTLIAKYANASRMTSNRIKETLEYKYLVYPRYPSNTSVEDAAYRKLEELLRIVVVQKYNISRFIFEVFTFLENNDMLDVLEPYIQPAGDDPTRLTLSHYGDFCLEQFLIPKNRGYAIGTGTYDLQVPITLNGRRPTVRSYQLIDNLKKMIKYVYLGQFDIRESDNEYILVLSE